MKDLLIGWKKQMKNNLYASVFFSFYVFLLMTGQNLINIDRKQPVVILFGLYFSLLFLSPVIIKECKNIKINNKSFMKERKWKFFFQVYIVSFLVQLIWLIGYYPGAIAGDNVAQLNQFVSNSITNHHPALHTVLVLGIPYQMFHSLTAIVIIQDIFFSLAFSYMIVTLKEFGCSKKILIAVMFFVLGNPFSSIMLLYPLKDTTMAILLLFASTMFIKIYVGKGNWLTKANVICLSMVLVLATIVRHNAVLFTGPFVLSLFIYVNRAKWKYVFFIIGCFVTGIWMITTPLYHIWEVEKSTTEHNIAEMYGLPMTILGNVLINAPDKLSDNTKNFLYEIASQERWENTYQTGSWNSMKWAYGRGNDVIEQKSFSELIDYFIDGVTASPKDASIAALELTNFVWSIDGKLDWYLLPTVAGNDFGFKAHGVSWLQSLLRYYFEFTRYTVLKYIFWFLGIINLLFIVMGISKGIKKFGIVLPALLYNFGTMLLLCGNDFRFFYYNYLIAPAILFLLVREEEVTEL